MQIGELDQRVTVQQPATVADSQGGRSTTYSALASSLPASVRAARANERLQNAAVSAQVEYIVTIRHRTDVTEAMRILWTPRGGGSQRTLQIVGVLPPDGRPLFLAIACVEVR